MNDLLIIGAGGFGREVAWLVERINSVKPSWNLLGFIDDNEDICGKELNGYKVLGGTDALSEYPDAFVACAVGASKIREAIVNRVLELNPDIKFATLIDPSVQMSDYVTIGKGTIVCINTFITVNITIGDHVIINGDCTVGHDAVLSDFVMLYPSVNISGNTFIGRCSELGTGTQIIQGKRVGDYSIIGAGAVIIDDVPSACTAVGVPAKPL